VPDLNHFIPFDPPFSVTTSSKNGIYDLPITTTGVYVHGDSKYTYTHYAGESAGESYTEFILPSDPVFLRKFADGIVEYAKKLEAR
jgi:O-acetylhomoserine/O-acetylserine sulfhydrylase-like pyridoxal-dependent enzyme